MTPRRSLPDVAVLLRVDDVPTTDDWHVRSMEFVEAVDEPFSLRLLTVGPDVIDARALVGARLELRFGRTGEERDVSGVVLRAELVDAARDGVLVAIEAGPGLALAGLAPHSRVFQDATLPTIVETLLGAASSARGGVFELVTRGCGAFEPIDDCVQWRESDLEFVARLLADRGIAWVSGHVQRDEDGDARERLVLLGPEAPWPGVAREPFTEPASVPALPYRAPSDAEPIEETIAFLSTAASMAAQGWEVSGWHWSDAVPHELGARAPEAAPDRARHDTGHEHDRHRLVERGAAVVDDTAAWATARLGAEQARAGQCRGGSDVVGLCPGTAFDLVGHPCAEADGTYLVLRVVHRVDTRPASAGALGRRTYRNEFHCVPAAIGHRPRARSRPTVAGPHTAIVVGPPGEEIHTDAHGRIRVRFPWDRDPSPDGSCWVRVAQAWSGQGFGALVLPRVGMEVVISYIDGDPDRPLCTGCVYNGSAVTPNHLPEQRARTTFRSSSTPGGGGYNELTIDDSAGHERVYLRAQRDLVEQVRADHRTSVGADQTVSVGRDQRIEVRGARTERVVGDVDVRIEGKREEHVLRTAFVQVDGRDERSVHGGQHVFVGCETGPALLRVDGTRQVQATASIQLACGPFDAATAQISMVPSMTHLAVGTSSITLLPNMIVLDAESIVLKAKGAELRLDDSAQLRAEATLVLARGPDFAAPNRMVLDGDVAIDGTTTTIRGGDRLELAAADGAGGTTIDGSQCVTYHSLKTRLEDGAAGFLEIAGGVVLGNG